MNDTESISSSRVLFGVAAAHKMLQAVTLHVDTASRPCLERLVEWKDNRGDEFDKPLPESGKYDIHIQLTFWLACERNHPFYYM